MKTIVKEYLNIYNHKLIQMESFFKSLSFEKAIEFASLGYDDNGKMNPHQHRVGKKNCKNAFDELDIQAIAQAITFDEIFAQTEKVRLSTHRIGHLWSYDTALRIGFHLNIYPTMVYLQ